MRNLLLTTLILSSIFSYSQEKRVLTLEECINIAVENNLTVQRSRLNLQSAEVDLNASMARRYPSLTANGNFGYNWGRSIDPNTNLFVNQRINFNSVGANSSLPIFQGFGLSNGVKQSRTDVMAGEFDLQRAKNDISLNVASFYLNVILNKELTENARFQLESSQEQLARTEILVNSGALPLANKLQLESQVATNEVNLINNQNSLDLSLLSLKQALLLPPGEEIEVEVPDLAVQDSSIESIDSYGVYQYALDNQPEIRAAEARIQSSKLSLKAAEGALYPSLNLNANINTNYSDAIDQIFVPTAGDPTVVTRPSEFVTSSGEEVLEQFEIPAGDFQDYTVSDQWDDNLRYSVSLGLFFRVFDGLTTRSNVQRAKISVQQSEINAEEERNTLFQNIETAYRNALAASRTYQASQKQVASLEETYRAVENQYNNGAANFTDYQVAENNLYQAQSDLSRSKFDFIFRQKILDFYLGRPITF